MFPETWGLSMNGGPHHVGRCPECGKPNGTCYNDLCEDCYSLQPVICPDCGCTIPAEDMTEHGCCEYCLDERAEKFTRKTLELINC